MKDDFIIPLNGLKPGKTAFEWQAGIEFFKKFENREIRAAEISVAAVVEKSGTYLGIDAELRGKVTLPCDRCGDDVELPVDSEIRLSVKFGPEPVMEEETVDCGEREVVYLPEEGADMDLSQTVYDFTCLSLPMQRTHREGECNPLAMKYITDNPGGSGELEGQKPEDNPFAVLKGLFDN